MANIFKLLKFQIGKGISVLNLLTSAFYTRGSRTVEVQLETALPSSLVCFQMTALSLTET